jgi:tetratricopeptide (TPR) repeat protein
MKRLLLIALVLLGCRPGKDQTTGSIDSSAVTEARKELPAALAVHLDSGNAAYRVRDYATALAHYRAAIAIKDDEAAPWFGIYMTELAQGHATAADSALKRARKLAPGASILR